MPKKRVTILDNFYTSTNKNKDETTPKTENRVLDSFRTENKNVKKVQTEN